MAEPRRRYGFVVCDSLVAESRHCLERLGVADRVEMVTFRSRCHLGNGRDVSTHESEALLDRVDRVFSVCQMCHSTLESRRARDRVWVVPAPAQGELFLGKDASDRALRERAFVVIPGWARMWEQIVCRDWKFDRPSARAFFQETASHILFLDTGIGENRREQVAAMADFVDLPLRERFVGTSHLELLIGQAMENARHEQERSQLRSEISLSRATAAEQATIADFITGVGNLLDETDVVARLRETVAVLFAPSSTAFVPTGAEPPPTDASEGSFVVELRHGGQRLGALWVQDVALPEYVDRYRPTAQMLCDAAAMALHAAILFQREQELAEALRSKVEELDDFAYVVSHDLKAPVANLRAYAEFLQEDYGDQLPTQAARFVRSMLDTTDRMKGQIDGLLKLSRAGRQQVTPTEIDLASLMGDVAEGLRLPLRERGVTLTVGSLPRVMGAAEWLREVFHNLVSNAVKYNDKDEPTIEIGGRDPLPSDPGGPNPTRAIVYVRDNGMGIPPESHERVFELFRRLDSAHGQEGSGAGLAIVRRVVEREGGRVWLESEPGQGATFFVALPRAKA